MEKRISYSQFQSVKCVAKACDPLISKRDKLREKIEGLVEEFKGYTTQINSLQAGIVQVIGFPVEALVKKVIEPGVDAKGQPKKTTKYLPTDIVSYDEEKKQYVINVPDTEEDNKEVQPEEISTDKKSETTTEGNNTEVVSDNETIFE